VSARLFAAVVALVAAVVLAGCRDSEGAPKASRAFCDAASKYDDRVQRGAKLDEQIRLVEKMAATAPAKIKGDAETFLDALRRVETDPSVKDNPRVKQAVEDVNRYAAQGCGFYERRPGGI
jgi:uncharacterized lipoprotein YehR (DUF1307 family)